MLKIRHSLQWCFLSYFESLIFLIFSAILLIVPVFPLFFGTVFFGTCLLPLILTTHVLLPSCRHSRCLPSAASGHCITHVVTAMPLSSTTEVRLSQDQ